LALAGQFLLVFSIVALSSPGRIDIVDGQTRYEVARSLVDHGDSAIRDKACWFAVYKGRDGDRYTDYRLPQSALGVVAIEIADATGDVSETRRQFFFSLISPCMAAVLAVLYALWFRRLGWSALAAVAWGAAGVFCTPSWYYGTSTFDDILGTTAVVAAVTAAWLSRDRRPLLGAAIAALAMAWAVNCKPPLVFFILPVLAAGYRPQVDWRRQLAPAALACFGILVGVVFYKLYHAYKFPPGADNVFAEYEKTHGSWTTPNPLPGLFSLMLSPSCGVLWYCPTLFLSWRGWRAWRDGQRWFCTATVAASLLFVGFICFLPFFKGEPCWGPRYMTPMFALWWVFVPAAAASASAAMVRWLLGLGAAVQLLGLSVDPIRLFIQIPLLWNYFNDYPWLTFDGGISHLVQRPREIVEVLTPRDQPLPEFSPAPLPTHAGSINTGPPAVASFAGLLAAPSSPGPLNLTVALFPTSAAQMPVVTRQALNKYHIFNAPRPWIFSQWYLSEQARPVDMPATIELLGGAALAGLLLAAAGSRSRRKQVAQPGPSDATAASQPEPLRLCSTR
jgi:hypothetical protein